MSRFIGLALVPFVVILLVLWCSAGTAHAATYEETCHRQPLLQAARVGETVEVCELHRVPSVVTRAPSKARHVASNARRPGVTTVMHYGSRPATYTIAYVR